MSATVSKVAYTVDYRRDEWHEWQRDFAIHSDTKKIKELWSAPLRDGNARIIKLVTTEEEVSAA